MFGSEFEPQHNLHDLRICSAYLPDANAARKFRRPKPPGADKKVLAGVLGIVLGSLGIHKFVLGYNQEGIILLGGYLVAWVITMVTCGIGTPLVFIPMVIGIVEGIMYLTKTDEEFVQTYIVNKRPWF